MSTGIFKDWWYGYEECTERELVGIYRRMNRRQTDHITDEPILNPPLRAMPRNASSLTATPQPRYAPKPCAGCGETFNPRSRTHTFCTQSCAAKTQHQRRKTA
jgi:hypothetical protein